MILKQVSYSEFLANGHRPAAIIDPVIIRRGKVIEYDGYPIELTDDCEIGYRGIIRIPAGWRFKGSELEIKESFFTKPRVLTSGIFDTKAEARKWVESVFEKLIPEINLYPGKEREETEETDETEGEIQG
jgi:hypothetical protein